jgi:hypothetical protein
VRQLPTNCHQLIISEKMAGSAIGQVTAAAAAAAATATVTPSWRGLVLVLLVLLCALALQVISTPSIAPEGIRVVSAVLLSRLSLVAHLLPLLLLRNLCRQHLPQGLPLLLFLKHGHLCFRLRMWQAIPRVLWAQRLVPAQPPSDHLPCTQ